MRVFFDTTILVAGLIEAHVAHSECLRAMQQASSDAIEAYTSCHNLAEVFSTLTRYPLSPRVSPRQAHAQIESHLLASYHLVELDRTDYLAVLAKLERLDLPGAVVYDALIGRAAEKAGAERLLTLNRRDFERLELQVEVREP